MKEPHYRQALAFGWQITWRHPFLWVYGLFAAILGQMGIFDFIARLHRASFQTVWSGWFIGWQQGRAFLRLLAHTHLSLPPDRWVWALWLIVFAVGVIGLSVVVAVISQGALIHAAAQGMGKNQTVAADSREWHSGVNHFWRLLAVNIMRKILVAGLAVLVGWAAYHTTIYPGSGAIIIFLLAFFLAAVAGVVLYFLSIYAAGYIIIEEYSLPRSLTSAGKLFLAHWLVSFEIGSFFLFFGVLLGLAALAGFILLLLPVTLLWFLSVAAANTVLFGLAVALLLIFFALLVMFLGSTFTVFSTSVWTYLFMKMHHFGIRSRILYWLGAAS